MSLMGSQRLRGFFGAVVGIAAFVAAGWGLYEVRYTDERTPLRVLSAIVALDDRTLRLALADCVGPLEVTQVSKVGAVVVTVELIGPTPEVGPACQGAVEVVLDEPLRDRAIIDGSTGARRRVTTTAEVADG